jgi:hypothetical protein
MKFPRVLSRFTAIAIATSAVFAGNGPAEAGGWFTDVRIGTRRVGEFTQTVRLTELRALCQNGCVTSRFRYNNNGKVPKISEMPEVYTRYATRLKNGNYLFKKGSLKPRKPR